MRPPLNAGENVSTLTSSNLDSNASMRPPLNAGENEVNAVCDAYKELASMRPPLNAGENHSPRDSLPSACARLQ